jgi:hypothetical protein
MVADSGYDDHKLYDLTIDIGGFELVCPVSEIYSHTSRKSSVDRILRIRIRIDNLVLERHH